MSKKDYVRKFWRVKIYLNGHVITNTDLINNQVESQEFAKDILNEVLSIINE